MSHYTKAKELFDSSLKLLNKQTNKEEWAVNLCKGLSEMSDGMKQTDQLVRGFMQMVEALQPRR